RPAVAAGVGGDEDLTQVGAGVVEPILRRSESEGCNMSVRKLRADLVPGVGISARPEHDLRAQQQLVVVLAAVKLLGRIDAEGGEGCRYDRLAIDRRRDA